MAKTSKSKRASAKTGSPHSKRIARELAGAVVGEDGKFSRSALDDAASFVAEAMQQRAPGEPAIAIASALGDQRLLRIAAINRDVPFLVDSIAGTLTAQGLTIDRMVHPLVDVERDDSGAMLAIGRGDIRESVVYIETQRVDARTRRRLHKKLKATLADVRAAVHDWPQMQAAMAQDATQIDGQHPEGAQLLRWLNEGMLTQLGHLVRRRDGSQTQMHGICRKSARALLADASYEQAFLWFDNANPDTAVPLVIKANIVSRVHRRVPIDLFVVPILKDGVVDALSIHAGVWTSAALATSPGRVPALRTRLDHLTQKLGFEPTSHAGRALVHALTVLPHDIAIGFSSPDLERVATTVMSLVDRPRPRLALVEAPLARHIFAFVWLPRDMLSTQARLQIQELVEEGANAPMLDWSLQVERGALAMLRFVLDARGRSGPLPEQALDDRLQAMLRGWDEAVESELSAHIQSGAQSSRLPAIVARYAPTFPASYRAHYGAAEAARDIERLRAMPTGGATDTPPPRDCRLIREDNGSGGAQLRLKVYQQHGALPLSDAVPALENFGFRVMAELPTALDEGRAGTIHDFELATQDSAQIGAIVDAIIDRAEPIEAAIRAVLNSAAEDDPFNRLVITAALGSDEANLLRAFYRYLRQAGMGFTIYTVVDALAAAPAITRALVDLFAARHHPDFAGSRDPAIAKAGDAIKRGLIGVKAINDDRLLRLYRATIEAVLRTNAYAPAGQEALAFKIDSTLVPGLPKPVPWREIFVYSPRVEGIHLRAGPIARGGLRWSDRRDDFRTEILGLMKAQRVKNAVIVPTGAKGGFYPKQLPNPTTDRDGWAAEGQASYEVFIATLLSITDNIVDGAVVHPDRVVPCDGEDPYFVVAADKGTARFSDVANRIAQDRGFWLGDAFASGGSNGYDHKAMGITARGAWVSVQRHFLEMGVDVQKEAIRVVGCGDMSGDVFGNGMLLSKAIGLVAAFDHRDIFIDPDPDPLRSWKERKRLFDLPRSSWQDYDPDLISKGGGVWSRSAKSITLPKRARDLLGVTDPEIEPDALIAAILRAQADLLWFGGIGTYIKAAAENNATVGDPANDALRIDAAQLRVKAIGEGANLGITQAGRIEFALGGGRINTDFIDNSAGVDCSDNEVTIKIALAAAMRETTLSQNKRNALLEAMTDEVAAIVLEDNRLQALALSIAENGGARAAASQTRLIEALEDTGDLDRQTEGLADGAALARRAADGIGLTRPELAVLLSSAKLAMQDAIENSDLTNDDGMEGQLIGRFPAPMRKKFAPQITGHRLRHEILATDIANRMINRLGLVHPFELAEEEGTGLHQVASAFIAAEQLFGIQDLWSAIDAATMPEAARIAMFDRLAGGMRIHMADLLRAGAGNATPSEVVAELAPGITELSQAASGLLAPELRQHSAKLASALVDQGAPDALAQKVVHLFQIDGCVGLARLARNRSTPATTLTQAFIAVGKTLGLDWAQATAAMMNPSDVWERLLVAGLSRDFQQMRLDFLDRLCRRKGNRNHLEKALGDWSKEHDFGVRQLRAMVGRAQAHSPIAPAMLAQIASQARNLLAR